MMASADLSTLLPGVSVSPRALAHLESPLAVVNLAHVDPPLPAQSTARLDLAPLTSDCASSEPTSSLQGCPRPKSFSPALDSTHSGISLPVQSLARFGPAPTAPDFVHVDSPVSLHGTAHSDPLLSTPGLAALVMFWNCICALRGSVFGQLSERGTEICRENTVNNIPPFDDDLSGFLWCQWFRCHTVLLLTNWHCLLLVHCFWLSLDLVPLGLVHEKRARSQRTLCDVSGNNVQFEVCACVDQRQAAREGQREEMQ